MRTKTKVERLEKYIDFLVKEINNNQTLVDNSFHMLCKHLGVEYYDESHNVVDKGFRKVSKK